MGALSRFYFYFYSSLIYIYLACESIRFFSSDEGKYVCGSLACTQVPQAHYMNADLTLACERCCVTNGCLQRLVWDRSVFLKRDQKCYVFK